jgi:hypothetical protein
MESTFNNEQITKFEQTDKLYFDFYKDDNYYTDIHYIYVNSSNEVVKIRREPFILTTPNIIQRDELLGILKRNSIDDSIQYSLLSILKYNMNLNPEDVVHFLKNETSYSFLSTVKNIDDVRFDATISTFQDLNDIILVFYEKSQNNHSNNITKKVYLSPHKHRKTTRKQHKG